MPKQPTKSDRDNPVWQEDDFRRARPAMEALPPETVAVLPRRRGERGPQRRPTKQQVSLRIDREVLAHFRATGRGWQRRVNEALKKAMKDRPRGRRQRAASRG